MAPERIQLRRTRGWRLPEGAVSVARPGRWGNPFKIGDRLPEEYGGHLIPDAETAVRLYRKALEDTLRGSEYNPIWDRFKGPENLRYELEALRGRDLACWCKIGDPCHGDPLLEVVAALPERKIVNPAELYAGLIAKTLGERT